MPIQRKKDPGSYPRISELEKARDDTVKGIKAGQSGDGYSKPDLHARLRGINGELELYYKLNPERRPHPPMRKKK